MKSSPHRPLILKRRKLPLSHGDGSSTPAAPDSCGQGNGSLSPQQARTVEHSTHWRPLGTPTGIISHPAMSSTPVLAIPAGTDVQSIIEALAAQRKDCGRNGPNKCILLSSSSRSVEAREVSQLLKPEDEHCTPRDTVREEEEAGPSSGVLNGMALGASESESTEGGEEEGNGSGDAPSCGLDNSLTNIQWLGKMSSDHLGPCSVKKETEKENQTPKQEAAVKIEDGATPSSSTIFWQESFTERPPYSYMAMIQFAINSTEKKRMMLKDIYTWIEDHFPYFKHVAKPGWKNSIRHNLSLHDMFVRETSANGKISFWTIHPEANRYLTLDQVFKSLDAGSPPSPTPLEPQQKRHTPDLQKNAGGTGESKSRPQPARRTMKPLLPRVNSYLVPIQFPLSQSLILQPSAKISLPVPQSVFDPAQSSKRVRIAPKILPTDVKLAPFSPESPIKEEVYCGEGSSLFASSQSSKDDNCQVSTELFPAALSIKKESDFVHSSEWDSSFQPVWPLEEEPPMQDDAESNLFHPVSEKQKRQLAALQRRPSQETLDTKGPESYETSRSRRKQHLALPCPEEPLLPLQHSRGSDVFTLEHNFSFGQGGPSVGSMPHLHCSHGECGPCKASVKEMFCKLPASSHPCEMPTATASMLVPDPWRLVPLVKETSTQSFNPRRSPSELSLSPQEDLAISTSVRPSMFDSPSPVLLNTEAHEKVLGPLMSSASGNYSPPEFQASVLPINCSLRDSLVLGTMNDSLSKILLDVSFPGFDEDNLETDLSWSQFVPDLK